MAISFSCATCGKPYVVDERFAGKKAACRMCGNVNLIPSAEYASLRPSPLPEQFQQPGSRPGVIPDDFDPLPLSATPPEEEEIPFAEVDDQPPAPPAATKGAAGPGPVIPVAVDDDDAPLDLVDDEPPPPRVKAATPVPVQPLPFDEPPPPMPARPTPGPVPVVPVPPGGARPAPAKPMTATPLRALPVEGCPNCGEVLEGNAIFCTACGYNLKTGKAASTSVLTGGGADDEDDEQPATPRREPSPGLRAAAIYLIIAGVASALLGVLAVPLPALGALTTVGPLFGAMLCVIGAVIYFIDGSMPFAMAGGGATLFALIVLFAVGRKEEPPSPPPVAVAPTTTTAPTTQPELPKVERTGPDTFTVRRPKAGENVIAYWRPVLQDADPGIRLVAIDQLRQVPDPWRGAAIDEVATRATDEDVAVRRSVTTQLALAKTPKTVAAAIRALDDDDPQVAALAVAALANFKDDSAITPLAGKYAKLGEPVLEALAGYGPGSRAKVAEAFRSILTTTSDAKARGRVMGLIVKASPAEAGPLLVQYVADGDAEVRALSMGYLAELKYAPAAPQIVERLAQDPNAAAKALVAYGPVAEKALTDKLALAGGDAKARLAVLWVLKQTATMESLPAVQAAAKDADLNVATGAREVWRRIDPQGLSPVDEVLMDLPGAKPFAVRAIESLKTLPADHERRAEVARALYALLGTTAGSAGADAEVQNLACEALKTWADDTVKDMVIAGLRPDGEQGRQPYLIRLAVHFKDARAVRALCEMLAQSRATPEVVAALKEFGTAPEEHLIKLLATNDAGLQEKCFELLREVGTRRCFRALTAIAQNKTGGDERLKKLANQTIIDINRRLNTAAAKGGPGAATQPGTTRPATTVPLPRPAAAPVGRGAS